MENAKIAVLIPAYNESVHIESIVKSARCYLPVLVVDDGSTDATAKLAESTGEQVIRLIPNKGKGAALRAGFAACLEQGFDAVITLDADGQHDPNEIPLFVDAFRKSGSGLIIGKRDFSKMPASRKIANSFGKWMISLALRRTIADNQSGYRLIARQLIELLQASSENGFEFEVEMLALCIKHDLGLEWVPIQTIYRDEKSHIRPLHHILQYFRIVRKARNIIQK